MASSVLHNSFLNRLICGSPLPGRNTAFLSGASKLVSIELNKIMKLYQFTWISHYYLFTNSPLMEESSVLISLSDDEGWPLLAC